MRSMFFTSASSSHFRMPLLLPSGPGIRPGGSECPSARDSPSHESEWQGDPLGDIFEWILHQAMTVIRGDRRND